MTRYERTHEFITRHYHRRLFKVENIQNPNMFIYTFYRTKPRPAIFFFRKKNLKIINVAGCASCIIYVLRVNWFLAFSLCGHRLRESFRNIALCYIYDVDVESATYVPEIFNPCIKKKLNKKLFSYKFTFLLLSTNLLITIGFL